MVSEVRETTTMMTLKHKHLVQLIWMYLREPAFYTITEFTENGNSQDYLCYQSGDQSGPSVKYSRYPNTFLRLTNSSRHYNNFMTTDVIAVTFAFPFIDFLSFFHLLYSHIIIYMPIKMCGNFVICKDKSYYIFNSTIRFKTLNNIHALNNSNAHKTVQLFVSVPSNTTITLHVDIDITIKQIKVQIENKVGIFVDQQRLIFGVKQLNDSYTLMDYDIQNDSTMFLLTRLNGGMLNASNTTSAVSVKAPEFNTTNPTSWFTILEAQFKLANITAPSTKFYHALANLPCDTVNNIDDTIIQSEDYDRLKETVNRYHEQTRGQLFERFLRETPLVGKPSHYLLEMRKIANKVGVGEEMIRHRFQQALPQHLAPIIASQKTTSLDDIGTLADELTVLIKDNTSCSLSSDNNRQKYLNTDKNYSRNFQNRNSSVSKFPLSLRPFSEGQLPKVCRSHIFFGERAKTCRPWCKWPNKSACKIIDSRSSSPTNSTNNSPSKSVNI